MQCGKYTIFVFQTSWWPSKHFSLCLQRNLKFTSSCDKDISLVFLYVGQFSSFISFLNGMADSIRLHTNNIHICKTIVLLVPQMWWFCFSTESFIPKAVGSLWSTQQLFAHRCSFHLQSLRGDGFVSLCRNSTVIFETHVCKTYPPDGQ